MEKIIGNNGRLGSAHHQQQGQHGANRQPRPNPNQANQQYFNHQQQRQRVPQNNYHQQQQQRTNNPNQMQRPNPQNMNNRPTQGRPPNSQGINHQHKPPGQQGHHPSASVNNHHRPQQTHQARLGGQANSRAMSPSTRPAGQQPGQQRPNQSAGQQRPSQHGITNGTNGPPSGPPLPNVLPKGWKREEIVRTKGMSAGIVDVVYVPSAAADLPAGKKFRSKLELHRHFGTRYDMSLLDYRSGKLSQVNWRKVRRNKSLAANNTNYASAAKYDNYLNLPIRQTASIFKQAVTYKTNNHKNEPTPANVLSTPVNKATDKPKPTQLFWEMRFNNLRAVNIQHMGKENEDLNQEFDLKNIPKFKNFELSNENVLRSVAASWYINQSKSLTGQEKEFAKNARIFIDREQPLIPQTMVKEAEIKLQEQKMKQLREQVQLALKEMDDLDYMTLEEMELHENEKTAVDAKVEVEKQEMIEDVEEKPLVVA